MRKNQATPMKILVAADIYGRTAELQALVKQCCPGGRILSPWAEDGCPYATEAAAHTAFLTTGGVEAYAEKLSVALAGAPAYIVGFSVGATAGWLHAAQTNCHPASRGILFYGSRIRLYPGLNPGFPLSLIFAEQEPAFSPAELATELIQTNVQVEIAPATCHGFMNPLSPGFAPRVAKNYRDQIKQALLEAKKIEGSR